jgi:hypothetical protein
VGGGGLAGEGRVHRGVRGGFWVSVFVLLIGLHEPSFHAQFYYTSRQVFECIELNCYCLHIASYFMHSTYSIAY